MELHSVINCEMFALYCCVVVYCLQ